VLTNTDVAFHMCSGKKKDAIDNKASEQQTSLPLAAHASIKRREMVGIEKNFKANDGAYFRIDYHSYKFPSSKSTK